MIFGAGLNQLSLINTAKNLGLETIVIDPSTSPPGKLIADIYLQVGKDDYAQTKAIALKHKVSGIITAQMENPLLLMARLAEDLKLPFPSYASVMKSRDKYLMKKAFQAKKVPCAEGILVSPGTKITEAMLGNLDYPMILKPTDANSSKGVFRICKFEDIGKYRPISEEYSGRNEVILEEFLEGPMFSAESVTHEHQTTIVQFTERHKFSPYPHFTELAHIQPASFSQAELDSADKLVRSVIAALGLNNCAGHTEFKLTATGPKVIEHGARLGGDFNTSHLVPVSSGINIEKAAIQISVGERPELTPNLCKSWVMIKWLELEVGRTVDQVLPFQDIIDGENVCQADIYVKKGDVIPPLTDSSKRPGFVIVKANNRDELLAKADHFEKVLSSSVFYA